VSTAHPDPGGKVFAGVYARGLLAHLLDSGGPDAVARVLSAAGESRSAQELSLEITWSTYAQIRALLEAAATELGGPEHLVEAGRRMIEPATQDANLTVVTGQSPDAIFEKLSLALIITCPIIEAQATKVGENEWLVSQSFVAPVESFEAFCALQAGGYSLLPVIYGLPMAEVSEEQCRAQGAPCCLFRVRWRSVDPGTRLVSLLQAQVRGLETWLSEFEQTVTNLVSSQDLTAVLAQSFAAACRAVHAVGCVLALQDPPAGASGHSFSFGIDPAQAEQIAGRLLAGTEADPTQLVAEVYSARRRYGVIAALRPGGDYHSEEVRRLEAYARLIAAALDSEYAVEEARRQGQGARALLELSTALARITTVEEVPETLVRAVPGVTGFERVAVLMPSADRSHWAVRATYGYPAEIDQALRANRIPMPRDVPVGASILAPGLIRRSLSALAGTGGAMVIPMRVNGEWVGSILAPIDHGMAAAGLGRDHEERLAGLAAQASTAIYNAMLLSQVRHQAMHDPLTGLPNRALILDRAEQMLTRARDANHSTAALFIDLDGFKEINDTFGHAAGDELLLTFAARLKTLVRAGDTVGRLGGDEFVVLLEDPHSTQPEQVAERLLSVAREPFAISDLGAGRLSVTASIGIASGDRANAGQLLRDADVALYDAKASGKNRYVVFREQMQLSVHDRVLLQMDLQDALHGGQFSLLFQPYCDLSSARPSGVEVSARWRHPERGELSAAQFGPLLEESEAILDVGRWTFAQACAQVSDWRRQGWDLDLTVPVASHQLHHPSFLDDLDRALRDSQLPASRLVVAVSEQAIQVDQKATFSQLESLHVLGVRIAVDGFGTGAFSLTSLRDLPIDLIKIDDSFVRGMHESPESTALVRSLIQLAKALGLTTVAAGIERPEQQTRLIAEGCDYGLGTFIAPASPAGETAAFLGAFLPR
jgi:diguanylate cyclase (GGDEF)-like protein